MTHPLPESRLPSEDPRKPAFRLKAVDSALSVGYTNDSPGYMPVRPHGLSGTPLVGSTCRARPRGNRHLLVAPPPRPRDQFTVAILLVTPSDSAVLHGRGGRGGARRTAISCPEWGGGRGGARRTAIPCPERDVQGIRRVFNKDTLHLKY